VRPGLAGVVEEQASREIEAVDFRKQLGEALFVVVDGLAEEVDVAMTGSVLVDSVAVITVADDQGVDAVKLGDEHF